MVGSRAGASHAGITSFARAIVRHCRVAMLHVSIRSWWRQAENHAVMTDGLIVFRRLFRGIGSDAVIDR